MVKKYNNNNKLKQKKDPNIIYNDVKHSKNKSKIQNSNSTIVQNEMNNNNNNNNNSNNNNNNNNNNNDNININNNQNLSQVFKGNNLGDYLNKIVKDEKSYRDLLEECQTQAAGFGLDPNIFKELLKNTDNKIAKE